MVFELLDGRVCRAKNSKKARDAGTEDRFKYASPTSQVRRCFLTSCLFKPPRPHVRFSCPETANIIIIPQIVSYNWTFLKGVSITHFDPIGIRTSEACSLFY
ncbi:hypothetical protein RRG08_013935 [Elysia crispata]|uniref:Uncharacterized protein n=1 Tax=Elysia crispata TaxID=231223 RepID=A0AAE1AET8_9GAST|nr:hypothetical protein RRG08_013935 [Elysia crispata]